MACNGRQHLIWNLNDYLGLASQFCRQHVRAQARVGDVPSGLLAAGLPTTVVGGSALPVRTKLFVDLSRT
jgi:hypothetical protein